MLPKNQNINYATIVAAIAGIFAYFFPGIPDPVRGDILVLLFAAYVAVVPYLHNLVNHPANNTAAKAADMAKKIAPVLCALLLAGSFLQGCANASASPAAATTTAQVSADPLAAVQKISQFTLDDLKAADADAVASNDAVAHACYPALEQFISSLPGANGKTTVVGAFSAFQKARDLRNSVAGGVPNYLVLGCGPLYAQVHGDLLMFLAGVVTINPAPALGAAAVLTGSAP